MWSKVDIRNVPFQPGESQWEFGVIHSWYKKHSDTESWQSALDILSLFRSSSSKIFKLARHVTNILYIQLMTTKMPTILQRIIIVTGHHMLLLNDHKLAIGWTNTKCFRTVKTTLQNPACAHQVLKYLG